MVAKAKGSSPLPLSLEWGEDVQPHLASISPPRSLVGRIQNFSPSIE